MAAWTGSVLSLVVVLVCCLHHSVYTYPGGSPKCLKDVPSHESHKAQTSKSPYKVTVAPPTKDKDGKKTVAVTITAIADAKFKGFFLSANAVNSNDKIGKFTKAPKTKLLSCGASNAITHTDNSDKSTVTLTWTAPDKFTGNVEFKATVVKEFKEFWTAIKSSSVNIA